MSVFSQAAARVRGGADHHHEAAVIVAEMTLEEKLGCLDGDVPFWPGVIDMVSGGYYEHTWPAAQVERLGLPGIEFADGPRGCVVGPSTAFPVTMARGASFDPSLEERVGAAIGRELRASGATITGAVCMNLLRHPAWGRAQETYGEDPHHVGEMAAALTRGLQRHVMACMKHFALNSMENGRFSVDITVEERALHEVYLPHFKRVAAEGVASVMSAYNSVNGEWCGENATLLTSILRDEWGWDGFVISDFVMGLRDAVKSVIAGMEIEMPFMQQRAVALGEAVTDGRLPIEIVDRAVQRIVATTLRFDQVVSRPSDRSVVACDEHRALAREASAASMVLLRNDGPTLPLDVGTLRKVAVLGRLGAVRNLGDGGSSDVLTHEAVTPLEGLRAALPDVEVHHDDSDVSIVEAADAVIVVVGYTKNDEGEYIDPEATTQLSFLYPPADHPVVGMAAPLGTFTRYPSKFSAAAKMADGGDRSSLRLSDADEALIAEAAAAHNRVIVCVMSGSCVVMPWADTVSAVLMTWYPGMEGGHALADVLLGRSEPGGRLPFAVPTDEHQLAHFDRDAKTEVYDLLHGQWLLDHHGHLAHFPFGHGLSYTSFDMGRGELVGDSTARVEVANVGDRSGSTVVFVFGSVPTSAYERPARRLLGFKRVPIEPGEVATVDVELDLTQLNIRDSGGWVVEDQPVEVSIGFNATDVRVV